MNENSEEPIVAVVFDEATEITITELCYACSVEETLIEQLVEEGILEPVVSCAEEIRFRYTSVRRTRAVIRLQRDLGVNLPGAALALDLMDRIQELTGNLRRER
jgi:chaperone modulatory protein CbpM